MRCPHKRCSLSHSSALSKISGASWGREGEKVSFPSPSPAALSPKERKKKIEKKKNNQPPKHSKATNPKRGGRSGDAPGRLGSPAGSPAGEGGRQGRRAEGREEVPGLSGSPRRVLRSCKSSTTQLSLKPGRFPPLPLAPGRPAGPLARGEELEPCRHSPGCRSAEPSARLQLSAERERRLGPGGRVDLASPGLREGKASNIHHLWLCCCLTANPRQCHPCCQAATTAESLGSRDREVSLLWDSRWFEQAYILHQNVRACFTSGSSFFASLCSFLHCLNLRITPSPLQLQTFDHST
ncbi:uncharacterized protein LOC134560390 [Prinia subflava]|uniref:uncharacterized protein LOC134560390 n=1 Tax=Prinia subflava TaxID=208062 RepID=UPI002FDFF1AB